MTSDDQFFFDYVSNDTTPWQYVHALTIPLPARLDPK